MKKSHSLLYLTVLLLSVFGVVTTSAQQAQDALYIYRNDGGFNAFFFSDIDHIEYSKVDTLGVEQADYVVQEVHALDSVFRIPISAIDSVAFVTPETIYKPDVVRLNAGIIDYIVASDSATWIRVKLTTPKELLPAEGSKIVMTETGPFVPEGFGGLVTSVAQGSDGITITTEPLDALEVFERAVLKSAMVSRISDEPSTRLGTSYETEETFEMEHLKGMLGFTGSTDLINVGDIFSVTASPLGFYQYDINPSARVRAFASIDSQTGVKLDGYIKIDADIDFLAKIEGTLAARTDVPFPTKYTFIRQVHGDENGPFYYKGLLKVGLFVESSAEAHIETHVSGHAEASVSTTLDQPIDGLGSFVADKSATFVQKSYGVNYGFGDFTFHCGLFFEAATEFKVPFMKKLGFGHRVEIGPSLSMNAVYLTDVPDDLYKTLDPCVYSELDDDEVIKARFYVSWNPYVIFDRWQSNKFQETVNLVDRKLGVVPKIQSYRSYYDDAFREYEWTAKYEMQRPLAFSTKAGFAMFDKNNKLVELYWRPETYLNVENSPTSVEHDFIIDPIAGDSTRYYLYPVVTFEGKPILYHDSYYARMAPAYIIAADSVEHDEKAGELVYGVISNCYHIKLSSNANWLEVTWDPKERVQHLKFEALPPGMTKRDCKVFIEGLNSKGDVLVKWEFPAIQTLDEPEVFIVAPTSLDVPGYSTDFKGGELTQQITVTAPKSAKGIRLKSSNEEWLTVDSEGSVTGSTIANQTTAYNVTIKGNTSLKKSRKATITVELTRADGRVEKETIDVSQSALDLQVELEPGIVYLEPEEDEGSKFSDTQTVNIKITPYDDFIASLIKQQDVKPAIEWIKATVKGSVIEIRGEANPVTEDRENTVNYILTLTTGETVTKTLTVIQLGNTVDDPFDLSTNPIRFEAKGGERTVTVTGDNIDCITNVDFRGLSWLGGAGSGKTITILCKENPYDEERIGDFYVTVKLLDGTKATMYFMVYQQGQNGAPSPSTGLSVRNVTVVGDWQNMVDGEVVEGSGGVGFNFTKDNSTFNTSLNGNNLHVTCKGHAEYAANDAKIDCTLSFDIIDYLHLEDGHPKIANVDVSYNSSSTLEMSMLGVKITNHITGSIDISCTNIPLSSAYSTYIRGKGTVGGGMSITSYRQVSDQYATYSDPEISPVTTHTEVQMVDSPSNSMEISVTIDDADD